MDSNPVEKVLDRLGCTGRSLAEKLGASPVTVSKWRGRGQIPDSYIPEVCRITGFFPWEISEKFPTLDEIKLARKYFERFGN